MPGNAERTRRWRENSRLGLRTFPVKLDEIGIQELLDQKGYLPPNPTGGDFSSAIIRAALERFLADVVKASVADEDGH